MNIGLSEPENNIAKISLKTPTKTSLQTHNIIVRTETTNTVRKKTEKSESFAKKLDHTQYQ